MGSGRGYVCVQRVRGSPPLFASGVCMRGGVSPRVYAYRGRGYVCVTCQLCGQGLCGGRFASGREKGAGVYCAGVGACLRVCVGCAAGAGQVRGVSVSGVSVLRGRVYVCGRPSFDICLPNFISEEY